MNSEFWTKKNNQVANAGSQIIKWASRNPNNRENGLIFPPENQNEDTHLFISQDKSGLSGSKNSRQVIGVSNHELVNNQPNLKKG